MAEYCSLEDAFRDWTSPVPTGREAAPAINGCTDDKAARAQRRAERRQAKRCKGPQARYIETQIQPSDDTLDPDRHTPRMELVEAMVNRGEDYSEAPTSNEEKAQATRAMLEITPSSSSISLGKVPSFFGANLEENYSPFNPNDEDGESTDFMSAFKQLASDKPTAGEALSIPSISNFWKPGYGDSQANPSAGYNHLLGTEHPGTGGAAYDSGANTAFYKALPAPGSRRAIREDNGEKAEPDVVQRRLQSIYRRLDELEVGQKHENAQSETVLFVLSGVFVLFALDLVSKL